MNIVNIPPTSLPTAPGISSEINAHQLTLSRGDAAHAKLDRYKPSNDTERYARDCMRKENLAHRQQNVLKLHDLERKHVAYHRVPHDSGVGDVDVYRLTEKSPEPEESTKREVEPDTEVKINPNFDDILDFDTRPSEDDEDDSFLSDNDDTSHIGDALKAEETPSTSLSMLGARSNKDKVEKFITEARKYYIIASDNQLLSRANEPFDPPIYIDRLIGTMFDGRKTSEAIASNDPTKMYANIYDVFTKTRTNPTNSRVWNQIRNTKSDKAPAVKRPFPETPTQYHTPTSQPLAYKRAAPQEKKQMLSAMANVFNRL